MIDEQTYRYFLLAFGLLCLIILILIGFSILPISQWIGGGAIIGYINSYLSESQKFARQEYILLVELHSFISPAIHNLVGANKDMLSSFSNLISNTSEIYMYAIITIEVMKYILIISEAVTPWLLEVLLFIGVIFGLYHSLFNCSDKYMKLCKKLIKTVGILFFVLHILLPYSLYITAKLSNNTIEKDRIESRSMLHNLYEHINYINNFKDTTYLENIAVKLPYKIELIVKYYTKYIVITGFEFMILPMTLFFIFIGLLRFVIKEEVWSRK